jgi:signal transduction histidine kinase
MALALLTTATIVVLALNAGRLYIHQTAEAHRQLDAMMQLAVHANRYSEQIAEVLLLGEAERPEFEGARAQVSAALSSLLRQAVLQASSAGTAEIRAREEREVERIRGMRVLFEQADRAAERVFELDRENRRDEAVALFRDQIEDRLDAEFDQIITVAMANGREAVEESRRAIDRLFVRFAGGAALALALVVAAAVVASTLFARSLLQPIEALTAAAGAVGRGDLDHRIPDQGRGELALLSQRFNHMVQELGLSRARLLDARAGLEREVAKRTRELEESNGRLKTLDRLRVRFLGEVSHELRTPLTVLRGEAEVSLRGRKGVAEYRDALRRIAEQAVEMGGLVDDLLYLARSEADQVDFLTSSVALGDILREAVRDGNILAAQKDIAVEVDIPDAPVFVEADRRRMRQAILILLDNAVKYSDPGQVVQITMVAGDGRTEVVVRDHGDGIATEDLPNVFEHYYRGGDASRRARGGLGLGLSIAKGIVERHGGAIAVASEPGGWTEVRIVLPTRQ